MQLIEIKDGGITRPKYYDMPVGVIHLIVSDREAEPQTITGLCCPEHKSGIIAELKKMAWEVDQ